MWRLELADAPAIVLASMIVRCGRRYKGRMLVIDMRESRLDITRSVVSFLLKSFKSRNVRSLIKVHLGGKFTY